MRHRKAGSIAVATAAATAAALGGLAPAASALTTAKAPTATHLNCGSPRVHAGRVEHCGVSVTTVRGRATPPTGAVTLNWSVGPTVGTLSKSTCTLVAVNRRTARCRFTYTPKTVSAQRLYASYLGDATHAPSRTNRLLVVIH